MQTSDFHAPHRRVSIYICSLLIFTATLGASRADASVICSSLSPIQAEPKLSLDASTGPENEWPYEESDGDPPPSLEEESKMGAPERPTESASAKNVSLAPMPFTITVNAAEIFRVRNDARPLSPVGVGILRPPRRRGTESCFALTGCFRIEFSYRGFSYVSDSFGIDDSPFGDRLIASDGRLGRAVRCVGRDRV